MRISKDIVMIQIVTFKPRLPLLLLASLCALTGCKPDSAVKKGEVFDQHTPVPTAPAAVTSAGPNGSVSGVVHFTGKAPERVSIDMSMDPACSLTAGQNLTEQYIVNNGKLADVYIYVKSGAPASSAPAGTPPVILDQKGCRYTPHVIAVQQGGTVEFHNSDPTMHNVHAVPAIAGNQAVDVSQGPMGAPQSRQFNAPEVMMPIRCNNHPWMEAFLNVSPTPWFAVTGPDGSFTLHGLPAGHYTLAAVHQKLGEQDIQVDVPADATAKADFTFSGK